MEPITIMKPIKHAYLNKIHIELVLMYLILFLSPTVDSIKVTNPIIL